MEMQISRTPEERLDNSEEIKNGNYSSVLFSFVKYIFFSILLVHLFGLFGIFLSLAYPLVWFFLPSRVFCFYCLHKRLLRKEHAHCSVCNREVITIYNPPFRSMIINVLTMLFLSLIFLILIIFEFTLISQLSGRVFFGVNQATFVSPSVSTSYNLNKPFYFDVVVDSPEQAVNLVKVDINFDPQIVQVVDIDTTKSFATIFSNKEFSNDDGTIRVIGGLPNPGYLGDQGLFVRIQFKAVGTGASKIQILDTSKILANDGKGTNILNEYISFPITVEP